MVISNATVFTICDGANVREGLLSVLGGGINKLSRDEFPAELGSIIAIQLQIEDFEVGDTMQLEVEVTNEDGTPSTIPSFSGDLDEITASPEEAPLTFPFMLDAKLLPIESPGKYRMALKLNGEEINHILFQARLNSPGEAEPEASE